MNAGGSVRARATRAQAPAASRTFVSRGVTYHALEWGARPEGERALGGRTDQTEAHAAPDRTPLLLLHGFAQSAASWAEVAAKLAHERFVAALDVVGHGESAAPERAEAYTFDAACAAIDAYADEAFPGTFALLGYSMGGRIALAYACGVPRTAPNAQEGDVPTPAVSGDRARSQLVPTDKPRADAHHAARLSALVLESAGLGPADAAARAAACARDDALAARLDIATPEGFADYWESLPLFATQRALPAEARARLRAGRLANNPQVLARSVRGMGQHRMADFSKNKAHLDDSPFPVLYIAGILDEKYATIAETIQNGRNVSRALLSAGHNTHFEDPAAFASLVSGFLRGVDEA